MFGVAPIRTRSDQVKSNMEYLPSHGYKETSAESALLRTRSLLESITRQHALITNNSRLQSDVKVDELAALDLLRSLLTALQTCILEHENPPPTVSKRKALIKVEKARRDVLGVVRECINRVTESKKLFKEVERFIELRPEEPVSPRHVNIRWMRQPAPRHSHQQRDQAPSHDLQLTESLCTSVMGLCSISECRPENATTTSDIRTPVVPLAPRPTVKTRTPSPLCPRARLTAPVQKAALTQAAAVGATACDLSSSMHPQQVPALGREGSNTAAELRADAGEGEGNGREAREVTGGVRSAGPAQLQDADVALMRQRPRQVPKQQLRLGLRNSVDVEIDLRPALSDAAHSGATTMCNIDSCVSAQPPTGAAKGTAAAAVAAMSAQTHGRYGPRRSGATAAATVAANVQGDDVEEGDEVNSADGRCRDVTVLSPAAGSPGPRSAMLGHGRDGRAAAAATCSTAASAPPELQPSAAPYEDRSASALQAPEGGVAAMVAASVSPLGRSARAVEEALRTLNSITADRMYLCGEARRQPIDPTHLSTAAAVPLPLPPPVSTTSSLLLAPGSDAAIVAAAAELDEIALITATEIKPEQHSPIAPLRYDAHPVNQHGDIGTATAAAAAAQAKTQPHHPAPSRRRNTATHPHYPHLQNQEPEPNNSAMPPAGHAASAPHPSGASGIHRPQPAAASHTGGRHRGLPPSLPSSLRDYPVAPGAAPASGSDRMRAGTSAGGAGSRSDGGAPLRLYGSQPMSGYQSMDSGQYPASGTAWDNMSLAETEPLQGADPGRGHSRRSGRRRAGGLLGIVRNVVGFVGVTVLSGAAVVLGAAVVNTGLDEQKAAQEARKPPSGRRGISRLGRGGGDLIPQSTLQQLRSPDLLALGRG